ncbi:hypothetical protein BDZ89DRAFT_363662 [Hymenopellis radicata]|nr:hypothetical protein BDZ89DRAFT_363662 [Hymenopellis radicata]
MHMYLRSWRTLYETRPGAYYQRQALRERPQLSCIFSQLRYGHPLSTCFSVQLHASIASSPQISHNTHHSTLSASGMKISVRAKILPKNILFRLFSSASPPFCGQRRNTESAKLGGGFLYEGDKDAVEGDAFADVRLEAVDAEAAEDEPELERAEAPPEGEMPVTVVDDGAGVPPASTSS